LGSTIKTAPFNTLPHPWRPFVLRQKKSGALQHNNWSTSSAMGRPIPSPCYPPRLSSVNPAGVNY